MPPTSSSHAGPPGRPNRWFPELLAARLPQPDRRSCGAAVLVVAEAWENEPYARRLLVGGEQAFVREVLGMHRRVTGPVDVAGRPQLPWWRALGTPPWALARQLSTRSGVPHRVRAVWPWSRGRLLQEVREAVRVGRPVPVYVGSPWLPRHVVLVIDAGDGTDDPVVAYEPSVGRPRRVRAEDLRAGVTRPWGWPVPWFVVLPQRRGRTDRD